MRKILAVSLLTFSCILISCGVASTTIDLTISDYHFQPDTFTVPAGKEITVNIDNEGFVSHQFVIFKLDTDAGGNIGPEDQENVYWRFEVRPGHSDSATFIAPPSLANTSSRVEFSVTSKPECLAISSSSVKIHNRS